MVDCGATVSFIDLLFAQLHELNPILMHQPRNLTIADGRPVSSDTITHTV